MREIQIRPKIAEHDLQTKINNIRRLVRKDKVRVVIVFRGREVTHPDIGLSILNKVELSISDVAKVETKITRDGQYFMVLVIK